MTASEARNLRKLPKAKKVKQKPTISAHTKALAKADKYFSLWFRAIEADETGLVKCCTCGRYIPWKATDGGTQTGHWQSRGFNNTRFNPMNVGVQCRKCNYYLEGAKQRMETYLIKRYGETEIRKIEASANIRTSISDFELAELAKAFKADFEKTAKQKGLT